MRLRAWLVLFFLAASAWAAEGDEFQLVVENDKWAGTDRYYTNGIKAGFGRHLDALRLPTEDLLRFLAPLEERIGAGDMEFGLFLGQDMYTPKNIRIAAAQPYDRPWAAWLYVGGVAQQVRSDGRRLDTAELDLGVVGPAALGRFVQSNWHKLIGAPQPQGWSNQLPNEPAFVVSYLQKRRYGSDSFDIVPHGGVTVGTVMTLARVGATLRLGRNISGFGADTIEPGGVMLQNVRSRESRNEWYGFIGVDHRLVARNIFLDGTAFHDSASVERRPHVYDLTVGLAGRVGGWRLSVTRVRRSEEFHTAAGGGGTQFFHSINLGTEF